MIEHEVTPFAADTWLASDQLDRAVAAYMTRFTGSSRDHARSGLRCFLSWCADRHLHPLAARRPHLELYIRWMQEIRHFKPSTVSRRFSVVAGLPDRGDRRRAGPLARRARPAASRAT